MSVYSWTPVHNIPNEKYLGVAYVAFFMYVYFWKLNKDLNIQKSKMQVNRNTKQKYLCQWWYIMSHE